MAALSAVTFALSWWLGLYLLARDPRKPVLALAATGLCGFALVVALDAVRVVSVAHAGLLSQIEIYLVAVPGVAWFAVVLELARPPETWRGRATELSLVAVVAAATPYGVPVTLKMRTGWCAAEKNALALARLAESAGVAMVTSGPAATNIVTPLCDAYMDSVNERVTGTITLKLYKGSVSVTGRKSPNSLYSQAHVTFEQDQVYDQRDAEGFIKLNALRLRLGKMAQGK